MSKAFSLSSSKALMHNRIKTHFHTNYFAPGQALIKMLSVPFKQAIEKARTER